MKKIIVLLSVAVAGSSLCLLGCSKAKNSPMAGNSTTSDANGGSAAAGPTDLRIKWQAGKEYDMEMNLKQATDLNVPGQPVHTDLKLTQGLHYSPLKDLDNGGHQVEMEFDRENVDVSQNGKEVLSYDSTQKTPIAPNSPAAPVAAVMQAMLGVPLDYTFAADGTIQKIDGLESLASRIAAAVPDQRQRVSLAQLFDQDTLRQYGSFSRSLPDHPVRVGDNWSSSDDINSPAGVMTADSTYMFKNWEEHDGHHCVHLLINGDIKTKTASASAIGAVVKIQKGVVKGDAWFDPDLGMFVEINTDQDLKLNITTRSMALTERLKQNVEMSLLGVSP